MSRTAGTMRLFVDEVTIHVRAGKGGNGIVSFHREKFVPKGGPDGGDGGHGGSVFMTADPNDDTLLTLAGRHHWFAENGRPGEGGMRSGRRGANLEIRVPPGTLIYDAETGQLLKDLVRPGQTVCVARGGKGGLGNVHFKSSTHQTPREFTPGGAPQERKLRLELKLIADIGLVGLPNAGKSTLLSRLTRARPKIAAYPFTTREPYLGIAELPGFRRIVLADLPGLIEGAHEGVGLGDAFLKHIERTRVIAHLIDLCPPEGSPTPVEAYRVIRGELEKYSPALAHRPEVLIANKLDLTGADEALAELSKAVGRPVLATSGVTGQGLREVVEALWTAVQEAKVSEGEHPEARIDFGAELLADEAPREGELGASQTTAVTPIPADDADALLEADDFGRASEGDDEQPPESSHP